MKAEQTGLVLLGLHWNNKCTVSLPEEIDMWNMDPGIVHPWAPLEPAHQMIIFRIYDRQY